MTGLLGPNGRPISSGNVANHKKAAPPPMGEKFGQWAGDQYNVMKLPGGGAIQIDLDGLTLGDYRQMKDHYQVNASLSVLTFMLHQMEWHIEGGNPKQNEFYETNMRQVWSRLVRGMSQAFWAGYAPNVLQWENEPGSGRVVLSKVKDLIPDTCTVNWKLVDGYAEPGKVKPKIKIYDGIKQDGWPGVIPVDNTFWYPLLMENGDYYGKKLLRSAFQPWFFSILLHLFSNRYYERFGEPLPVGRAPYEDNITVDGASVPGNKLMEKLMGQIRNRSVVVLPNDKTQHGEENTLTHDYSIEYLESQMRGADFERYMTRLDEEISLALFTPILMMRTADVGSYNLGTQHTQVYQWMLNAIGGDWEQYINKYVLRPMRDWNFGTNAPMPRLKFTKLGKMDGELLKSIFSALLGNDKIKLDVRELGEAVGLTIQEVEAVTDTEPAPKVEQPEDDDNNPIVSTKNRILARVAPQMKNAFEREAWPETFRPDIGFRRMMIESAAREGVRNAEHKVNELYADVAGWFNTVMDMGKSEFNNDPDHFMEVFEMMLTNRIERTLA